MPKLNEQLEIERCPHCAVNSPNLANKHNLATKGQGEGYTNQRIWKVYVCQRCGGVVTAWATDHSQTIQEIFPTSPEVDTSIPKPASTYLSQALQSLHAPAGAVMLAASAVDAMLKAKDYKEGSLYKRINQAASDNLITEDMAAWAHDIRLDANDQRHADETATLPTPADGQKSIDFALALGQFLFVLPARVQRGLAAAKQQN